MMVPRTATAPVGSAEPEDRASARTRRHDVLRPAGLLVAVLLLVAVALMSIAYGARPIALGTVLDALTGPADTDDAVVVRSLRVPRTLLGIAVGAALGLSGAVMQGLTRNPLADPGILGVSAGASFAVVVGIAVMGVTSLTRYVWFAFAGAAVVSVIVYLLGSLGRGGASPVKLALAGAALSALLGSMTTALVLLDAETLDAYRFWVVGSLAGRDAAVAGQVAPFMAVGLVLAMACARSLNALALGEDVARSLGQNVAVARVVAALAVTVLTGAAVAACGPIGFVGLVVPHVARAITGPDHRWLLPYCAVLSPVLLLGADVIGRLVVRPGELQVGIVTAVIGAPFFIALVRRRRLAQL